MEDPDLYSRWFSASLTQLHSHIALFVKSKRSRSAVRAQKRQKNIHEDDTDSEQNAMISTESEDTFESQNEFECDAEFRDAEHAALQRVDERRSLQTAFADQMTQLMAQELSAIEQYILADEAYHIQTTGKSPWTLRRICREIHKLQVVMQLNYRVFLEESLLRVFAANIFVDQRAQYRDAFLFKFIQKSVLI